MAASKDISKAAAPPQAQVSVGDTVGGSAGASAANPPFHAFEARYAGGEAQVVYTRLVADLETPVSAYLKIAEGRAMSFLLESVEGGATRGRYSVIVAGPVDWLESRNANFLTRLAIALALSGLGLVAVTLFQVRFGLLPLRAIEERLAAVRSGQAQRLEGELPAEIEPLQTELNALLRSNQEIVERARTQVGNLAHALKTPLAVITNEAREDKSALGAKVAEQATLMRDQVSHYLDRARMAARVAVIGRVTDVPSVVEPLVRALERIHRERGVKISATCPPGLRFQGERHDLEEMLGNLLDNACKWAQSEVYLNVAPAPQQRTGASRISITVDDDGPGLTEEQRKRIGKRGLRLDETKPGSGLGLSIVNELVQLYHGEFSLDRSPHGGLSVRLDLPGL